MEQAVSYNKQNWSYIEAILKNHAKRGRKTREEAENALKQKEHSGRYDFDDFEKKALKRVQDEAEIFTEE